MNNLKGKELDEFFKQQLSEKEPPFNESHWLALEERLKKDKRRRVIWIFATGGIAAILFIGLALLLKLNNETTGLKPENQTVAKNNKPYTEGEPTSAAKDQKTYEPIPRSHHAEKGKALRDYFFKTPSYELETNKLIFPETKITQTEELELAHSTSLNMIDSNINTLPHLTIAPQTHLEDSIGEAHDLQKRKDEINPKFKSALSLSVFAGPDINGVNNLRNTGNGISAGLALTYSVHPKWSFEVGAAYAKKLYSTDFSNYKPTSNYKFPTKPSMVDADCRVLDIPININYTTWAEKKQRIQISAGVSSYFMLKEDYYFDYKDPYYKGPGYYGIKNRNKHYLGIINLSVGYQRNLTKTIAAGISPYLKLPVTDIGYGNVKLQSAGITTSVSLKLPSFK